MPKSRNTCVLMFSGGRDSTLAAVRLASNGWVPALVTVTTPDLVALPQVRSRIDELARLDLPLTWNHVELPEFVADHKADPDTCFTCHQAYVVIGAHLAREKATEHIALGYAGYQASWPEQSPAAVQQLREVLRSFGFNLHLPVYDVDSKEAAQEELVSWGLSPASLEQKCLRQIISKPLQPTRLSKALDSWSRDLQDYLSGARALHYESTVERRIHLDGDSG